MELDFLTKYPYSEQLITHSRFDYIYISPHLDDVPLSCSGTICRQQAQGLNILVVTIFAGETQLYTLEAGKQQRPIERYWRMPR